MPRPAGNSYFALFVLLTLPFTELTATSTAASQTPPSGGVSRQALAGIWVLNRDLGDAPGVPNVPDGASDGRRLGGGGGGVSGRVGRGGQGRGFNRGGDDSQDLARRQATQDYLRTSMEASKQLTIVVHETSVSITDADGRVLALPTDDKKVSERAENGLVKVTRRNHWDGGNLVSEIEIDNGPKIVRTYSISPGGTQLRIATAVDSAGRPINLARVYERPVESR